MKRPYAFSLPYKDPAAVFAGVADRPGALLLDSADRSHPAARYSFIAFDPIDRFNDINRAAAALKDRFPGFTTREDLPLFQGGLAGIVSYDFGRCLERLPRIAAASNLPDITLGLYDQAVSFDHAQKMSWLVVAIDDETTARARLADIEKIFSCTPPRSNDNRADLTWSRQFSRSTYERAVQKIIDYIYAGDIFQTNLSQKFESVLPVGFDPYAHYLDLRFVNPAPFAGYFHAGDYIVSSASPERFLKLSGRTVETRPIKGTRRRHDDPIDDSRARAELAASEKDRAENTMIVDLMRNDLSKICTPDSVDVPALCAVETFARVHHLVSTVTGQLEDGRDAFDVLRACFPGGSITGAPKIRAMEIIEELEPAQRGPYCGSMGYIGFDGTMDMNILIRTLVYRDGKVWFNTGGGITADSVPADEYQETIDKAEAIFESFGYHRGHRDRGRSQR